MSAEVTEKIVTRYGCSCCRKTWSRKTRANEHVGNGCLRDPEVRACGTCEHDELGSPAGYEEPGLEACCEIGKREPDELYIRHCPFWVEARWVRIKQEMGAT